MLTITGARYADLTADAVAFRLGDVTVRVGRLERLLRAKDREFLRAFRARLEKDRTQR